MAALTTIWWRISHSLFPKFGKQGNVFAENVQTRKQDQNHVYLVGAGPGDPDLLTMKAYKAIQQADVLLIDWLVGDALYPLFPQNAERIFVGKRCGKHSMRQADINKLLVEKAKAGGTIVRLKGGDPSIFGRLAEECDALTENDIPFSIVPGITAASGCAAYSGIPLTHRDCSQSVKFVTAHVKKGGVEADWAHLAKDTSTLVFYMGLTRIGDIKNNLLNYGMRPDMPIAVIDQGTTKQQTVISSTLSTLETTTISDQLAGPALVVVGEVVTKRQMVQFPLDIAFINSK